MLELFISLLIVLVLLCAPLFIFMKIILPSRVFEHLLAFMIHDCLKGILHKLFGPPQVQIYSPRKRRRTRR